MSKKESLDKETKKQLKDELKDLLNSYGNDHPTEDVADKDFQQDAQPQSPYDFEEMEEGFKKESADIIDSILKTYVDLGIIDKNEALKSKRNIDIGSLSNLMFQLKTIKITIVKLMEQITSGNVHPRIAEVIGQLQDKLTMVTKTQANYMLFLEETYRKANSDSQAALQEGGPTQSIKDTNQFYIGVGTGSIIKELEEDADEESHKEYDTRLTDPTKKLELMDENNIEHIEDESEDSLDTDQMI